MLDAAVGGFPITRVHITQFPITRVHITLCEVGSNIPAEQAQTRVTVINLPMIQRSLSLAEPCHQQAQHCSPGPCISSPLSVSSTGCTPKKGRVALPGLHSQANGRGAIMEQPVSVCHHVSTMGHLPSPTTCKHVDRENNLAILHKPL